jgi:pimeloyl-ACP methyl ester carboxylesterase
LGKLLTDKQVIRVANSGHFPQEEASEQLIKVLRTFIGTPERTEEEEKDTYS